MRDDITSAYKKETEWQTNSMLPLYKKMCAERKVEVETMVIEADDVAEAISAEITKFTISRLVIGASSGNVFTRKSNDCNMFSKISSFSSHSLSAESEINHDFLIGRLAPAPLHGFFGMTLELDLRRFHGGSAFLMDTALQHGCLY